MEDIWKKQNLKDHNKVTVLNAPTSFEESIRVTLIEIQVGSLLKILVLEA